MKRKDLPPFVQKDGSVKKKRKKRKLQSGDSKRDETNGSGKRKSNPITDGETQDLSQTLTETGDAPNGSPANTLEKASNHVPATEAQDANVDAQVTEDQQTARTQGTANTSAGVTAPIAASAASPRSATDAPEEKISPALLSEPILPEQVDDELQPAGVASSVSLSPGANPTIGEQALDPFPVSALLFARCPLVDLQTVASAKLKSISVKLKK